MLTERKERSREIREIAYASLALALSVLFVSLSYVLPFSSLLMMLFVPILASLVAVNTRYKMQIIYIFAIVCVSFIDIQEGFFYLLPNTLIGLCFGNLIKQKISAFYIFLFTSILSGLLNSLSYYPILWIFGIDMIDVYSLVLNLERNVFVIIYPSFCFLLAIVETFFLLIISSEELRKFGIIINEKVDPLIVDSGAVILSLLSIILVKKQGFNIYNSAVCTLSFIPCVFSLIILFTRKRTKLIAVIHYLPIISVFIFCACFVLPPKVIPLGLLLSIAIYPLCDIIFAIRENEKVCNGFIKEDVE